ncbi:MAG TPA: glycosyltransferase family 4 protein [Bacteroidales bacterium]|nr:glycosyltransferase family 4 protein [Bacteroidales bacterium]
MNILLINHYAGSPAMGMEYRPYYIAQHWIKSGHRVTIIASSFSHVRSVQPDVVRNTEIHEIGGVRYLWIKTSAYSGNSAKRFINILEFVFKLYLKKKFIIRNFKPDVVIASSTYPLDIYPAAYISKKAGAKLLYEIHDLWPLSPMEIGGYSKYHPFIMLMQMAENKCYKSCDRVISLLPKTLEHCINHGLSPEKWFYVPNGINLEEVENKAEIPSPQKSKLETIKTKYKFLLGYTGSIGMANALDAFVLSAEKLSCEDVAVIIVGIGPEKDKLLKLKNDHKISNVFFIDSVPKNTIQDLLGYFDFLFLSLKKIPLYRFGISMNKLFDYMYSGKPVIQAIEAGNDIVSDAKCGYTIKPEDSDAIVDAVKKLISLSNVEKKQMGENGRQYVLKNHEYSVIADHFIKCLEFDSQKLK